MTVKWAEKISEMRRILPY